MWLAPPELPIACGAIVVSAVDGPYTAPTAPVGCAGAALVGELLLAAAVEACSVCTCCGSSWMVNVCVASPDDCPSV